MLLKYGPLLHWHGHRALQFIQKALHTWPHGLCSSSCCGTLGLLQSCWMGFACAGDSILLDVVDGAACRKWWCCFYKNEKVALQRKETSPSFPTEADMTQFKRKKTQKQMWCQLWKPQKNRRVKSRHWHLFSIRGTWQGDLMNGGIILTTFYRKGGGALLDSVELQQQAVQLR